MKVDKLILIAFLSAIVCAPQGAQTAPQASSEAILDRLPEMYRAKARELVKLPSADPQYWTKISDEQLFSTVVRNLAEKSEGISFVLEVLDKEPTPGRRLVLYDRLARSKEMQSYVISHPEAIEVLARRASSDVDATAALQALNSIRTIQTTQLGGLLQKRIALATAVGDQAGLISLSDEESRRYKWFGELALPNYFRNPPAIFSVVPEEKSIHAVAFGDFGTGSPEQVKTAAAICDYAKTHPFDFGLTLGDNFYPTGMNSPADSRWQSQWEQLYGPLGIKFYATLGNHDYGQPDSPVSELLYSQKTASWSLPALYYTFTAGPAQFFAIDNVDLTEREMRWLDEQLAQSKSRWKVVFGHYQIYSATRGDNDEAQSNLVKVLLPVLKKRHVDLYICGHDHNLQILKEDGGVHFVVAGGGGAGLYEFTQTNYTRNSFKEKTNGFAVLEADHNHLDVRLIDYKGKELSMLNLGKPSGLK